MDSLNRRAFAEALGTFWLVLGGCGSAVISASFPNLGIGLLGVAFAFGLSMLTMAFAVGHVSGAHLNPAVTLGLVVARRFPKRDLIPYWIAQLFGAILAAGVLYVIATGAPFFVEGSFASNGFGSRSPGGYSLGSGLLTEVLMTFVFVLVVLGSTHERAPKAFAPIAIGFCLTLIHLVSIPITNTSVNPARSTGPALVVGGPALVQLWLFWLAPLAGAAMAGALYSHFLEPAIREEAPVEHPPSSGLAERPA